MNYDVVVVGAGSAGCVLASRLSENPECSVLLLEAGPDYPTLDDLPPQIANIHYSGASLHDWDYHAELLHLGRTVPIPRAKLVGGCSATNVTTALRGAPGDFDEWASLGNSGWSFADVLPFFRRLERDGNVDNQWHGQDGPLPIRRYPADELVPIQAAFLDACATTGYAVVDDLNEPSAIGAGCIPMNHLDGIRQSTARTYLAQARSRPNLTVQADTLVDCIQFEGRKAVGVRLAQPAELHYGKTIILAAGAYGSPAILMRSGIGPAAHLSSLGIPVLEDLAGVGQNLRDHPLFMLRFATGLSRSPGDGPLCQTMLSWKSSLAVEEHDLHLFPVSPTPADPSVSPSGKEFSLGISVLKPLSIGQLCLTSSAPEVAPYIQLSYLAHPADMSRMMEAAQIARQLAQTPPLSDFVDKELSPGVDGTGTEGRLEAALRTDVRSYHHPVGTCRMGSAADRMAVVDPQGRVHGVESLFVVDASIMPTIPAANTNIPTIMVAERCADWLVQGPLA